MDSAGKANGTQSERKGIIEKLTLDETKIVITLIYRDPFAGLYRKTFPIYTVVLMLIVLWPFDFRFTNKENQTKWLSGTTGIEFSGEGEVISGSSTEVLFDRLVRGSGLSLELWCAPANTTQHGPAVIISYSQAQRLRNFTVGQRGTGLIVMLRTERTNLNGMHPHLWVKNVFIDSSALHLLITYDHSKQEVYVNGHRRMKAEIPGGGFSNWGPGNRLILGNDVAGDRPWLGKLFYVAVYDRALSDEEVRKCYLHGNDWLSAAAKGPPLGPKAVARYLFDDGRGNIVKDTGSLKAPLDLHIPEKIEPRGKPFLKFSWNRLKSNNPGTRLEMVLNMLLFIPFGFLLCAVLAGHVGTRFANVLIVLAVGLTISLSVESLQYFSRSRHSYLNDVAANNAGVLAGIVLKWGYDRFLNPFKRKKRGDGAGP